MQHTVTSLFGDAATAQPARRARVIAITSGKGGVGKTNVTANVAVALARQGKRVCIVDADTGLANINIVFGLAPRLTLQNYLDGTHGIDEILATGPRGVCIVPGASGIAEFAELDRHRQQTLLNGLQRLEYAFDYLLIDTAAGIGDTVIQFVLAAELALLVVSPDPTSLTDAFALTRVLKRRGFGGRLQVLVNMADSEDAARKVYRRFAQAVEKYLQVNVHWFGHVRQDRAVVTAIRLQHPVTLMQPEAPASQCFEQLATRLQETAGEPGDDGISGFLRRHAPAVDIDPARAAIDLIRGAEPSSATAAAPAALERPLIDFLQGGECSAEEVVAAIKPVIDAYVARFHTFPLDMREAIYRHLELADIPEHEIRQQVMLLEQMYEKRYQRPLLDKEDNLFRLLSQVRHSEPEFAEAIARLQHSYERQYHPPLREQLAVLLDRVRQSDAGEQEIGETIAALRALYAERTGRAYMVPDLPLRARIIAVLDAMVERESARQDALGLLAMELGQSADHEQLLRAAIADLQPGAGAPAQSNTTANTSS